MSEKFEDAEIIETELPLVDRMETFIGTQVLKAALVTKQEYAEYREWDVPESEDPNEPVYLVEYRESDDSPPNHKNHKGHISMSPVGVFENNYRRLDLESKGALVTGASFSEDKNTLDQQIKNKAAELIDLIQTARKVEGFLSADRAGTVAYAIRQIETGTMYAVKSTFIK